MLVEKGVPGGWAWEPGETGEQSGQSQTFFLSSASVSIFQCPSNLFPPSSASSLLPVCTPLYPSLCPSPSVALSFYTSVSFQLFSEPPSFTCPFFCPFLDWLFAPFSPLRLSTSSPSLLSCNSLPISSFSALHSFLPSVSARFRILPLPLLPAPAPDLVFSTSLVATSISVWDSISLCAAPSLPGLSAPHPSTSILSLLHPSLLPGILPLPRHPSSSQARPLPHSPSLRKG